MATLTSQPYIRTKTDYTDDRQNIFELQKFLQKISEVDPSIPFLNTDGIYGDDTRAVVEKFQATRGLPKTGVADFETWNKIFDEYNEIMFISQEALPFYVFPPNVLELKSGDSGDAIFIIQLILNDLASRYSNLNKVTVNGQYNRETAEAVKKFQSTTPFEQNGIVNRPTWNELTRLYKAFLLNE